MPGLQAGRRRTLSRPSFEEYLASRDILDSNYGMHPQSPDRTGSVPAATDEGRRQVNTTWAAPLSLCAPVATCNES